MSQDPLGDREQLARELENALRNVLSAWFPRCLDREHGGFLCDFDHRWRESGPQSKMLEFQARQTHVAALAAVFYPDEPAFRSWAQYGFEYLRDVMWDQEYGGWYRLLDRAGTPQEDSTKHLHGMSYAISACIAYFVAAKDASALDLATEAFEWIEQHAHDDQHGGYFALCNRNGLRITSPDDRPAGFGECDAIGTPIGLKDTNTHSDLMTALLMLSGHQSASIISERLHELFRIAVDRIVVPPGVACMYFLPDWTPVPDYVQYAHTLDVANELIAVSMSLETPGDRAGVDAARRLIDTMLQVAWDQRNGGFSHAGSAFGQRYVEDLVISFPDKFWWGQAEGLQGLLSMVHLFPEADVPYFRRFCEQWNYIKRYLIDSRYGGWFWVGLDTRPRGRKKPKATPWKSAWHETNALLACLDTLRAEADPG